MRRCGQAATLMEVENDINGLDIFGRFVISYHHTASKGLVWYYGSRTMSNTQPQNKAISRFIPLLPLGTTITVYITTTSMIPIIRVGQPIHITRVPFHRVQIGDIIAYTRAKRRRIIVHRVVGRRNHWGTVGFVTQGDNLPQKDNYTIYEEDFIGIVWV